MAERRHDLLTLTPAWRAPDAELAGWHRRGLPVMRRRASEGDTPGEVAVCVALPPRGGTRRRRAFTVPREAILRESRPPTLRALRVGAPGRWQPVIDAVLAAGAAHGVEPRVFGSLLWQHLAGTPCLGEASDLDLLWESEAPVPLARALAAIAGPPRLDGEIVFADGRAVQWRECLGGGEVLAKSLGGLSLLRLPPRAA